MPVVQFDQFGDPAEVLEAVDAPDPGPPAELARVFGEVGRLVTEGAIRVPVEAASPLVRARGGKVLLAAA